MARDGWKSVLKCACACGLLGIYGFGFPVAGLGSGGLAAEKENIKAADSVGTSLAPLIVVAQADNQAPVPIVGEKPKEKPPEFPEIFREQSVLTPKGTLMTQFSFDYAHTSSNRVAIEGFALLPGLVIGAIDVRRVDRDNFTAAVALRYGFTNRLETEINLPYVWRKDRTTVRELDIGLTEDRFVNADGDGLGDIEFGLRYQLNRARQGDMIYIGNLRVKSDTGTGPFDIEADDVTGLPLELPTGSGFWGIEGGLTAAFPSDPAVFFGNIGYQLNIPRDVPDFGEIDPGDAVRFNLGMGLAVNEKASISLGFEYSIVGRPTQDGRDIVGTETLHVGSLLMGFSYRLRHDRTLNISVAGGVSEDAPDVSFSVKLPIAFKLFE